MVVTQTTGEPIGDAGDQAGRVTAVQPPICADLSSKGRVSVLLELCLTLLGRLIFGQMVQEDDAIKDRTDEEGRLDASRSQRVIAQLVSRQGAALEWHC